MSKEHDFNSEEERSHAHSLDSLPPNQYEKYLKVPGWRILESTIFDSEEQQQTIKKAESKALTLRVHVDGKGYQKIWTKYDEIRGVATSSLFRGTGTFDRPGFLLEPISDEEINEGNEEDMLTPAELEKILLS